ncbi:MAG: tetratricopeptide repeat protein [Planctomycetota bacterium]
MALSFGRKKSSGDGEDAAPANESFSPVKAKTFFDRAQTVHQSTNYEYAMQLWLNGIGWDPTPVEALDGFLRSADAFLNENPKAKLSKDFKSALSAKGLVRKYVDALLDFGIKNTDTAAAVRSADYASQIGLREQSRKLGQHALALAQQDKKQKKDTFVKLLDLFERAELYQLAAQAGDVACRIDQGDGELQVRVRNMMARATMNKGGFEDTSEGGFRKNIRDSGQQELLEAADKITKTDDVKAQLVAQAKADHEARPDDPAALEKYARALLDRGKPADELKAIALYTKGFQSTGQFRFRQRAGEINLKRAKRTVASLKAKADASPDDAELRAKYEQAAETLSKSQVDELTKQVEHYPTDLALKYELGKRLVERGRHDEAIEQFQLAQDDAKNRRGVLNSMGQAFMALEGWEDAAVDTYRKALGDKVDDGSPEGLEIRYGLMQALYAKAQKSRDAESAEEADKLAAGIAIQQFSYREVREWREKVKALLAELKA